MNKCKHLCHFPLFCQITRRRQLNFINQFTYLTERPFQISASSFTKCITFKMAQFFYPSSQIMAHNNTNLHQMNSGSTSDLMSQLAQFSNRSLQQMNCLPQISWGQERLNNQLAAASTILRLTPQTPNTDTFQDMRFMGLMNSNIPGDHRYGQQSHGSYRSYHSDSNARNGRRGGSSSMDYRVSRKQQSNCDRNETTPPKTPPRRHSYHQETKGNSLPRSSKASDRKGVKRQLDINHDSDERPSAQSRDVPKKRTKSGQSPSTEDDQSADSCIKPTPPPGYKFDEMSQVIWNYCVKKRQTEEIFKRKMMLRDALYSILKGVFPYCGLYVVGSSMNGFGSNNSDMDMCLMLTHGEVDQRFEAPEVLLLALKALKECDFIKNPMLIKAKVPILKFNDKISGVEVDLNINNAVGIRNTHLLHAYSKADWRVKPLVLFVKHWAKIHDINDASKATISSFSLVLMVLHYLQCGCSPAVIPSLQQKFAHKFSADLDITSLRLEEDLPPFNSLNKQTLGELFLGFLEYYGQKFDFKHEAISIRLGCKLPVGTMMRQDMLRNPVSQWKWLCIEEPFNLSNTARSVYDEYAFQRIRKVFRVCALELRQSGNLDSVLTNPA
ncbi:poly(A) RNA polymerase GLD2-like [Lingula anatina]|uniref:Poly(A) RNA polymerase GLD2-like n=1 Tax=Lingula anatina TaxID=7574 RepID=A0A1S3HZ58_LINAN|nr:poly(A) RNA polymerase GLD2-like [Lingula anatina]|eukprot:XP_013391307.1 poly(A) RNA polymerase GLD2-like [Lingula anatina]